MTEGPALDEYPGERGVCIQIRLAFDETRQAGRDSTPVTRRLGKAINDLLTVVSAALRPPLLHQVSHAGAVDEGDVREVEGDPTVGALKKVGHPAQQERPFGQVKFSVDAEVGVWRLEREVEVGVHADVPSFDLSALGLNAA